MRYLVIYDVTDDNLRTLISETLKDYGLDRIQYSAFMGTLRHHELNSIITDLKQLITDKVENVQIYPLCDMDFKGRKEVGKPKRYEVIEEKPRTAYI